MRTENDMRNFFMRDMKNFKVSEQYNTFKTVLFAIVVALFIFVVVDKLDRDLETFKNEQAYRMERQ